MTSSNEKTNRILLVEDDFLVALDAEDTLSSEGNEVAVATSVSEAMKIIGEVQVDCAILDFNLGNETVMPVVEKLRSRRVPYAIVSGADNKMLDSQFGSSPGVVFRKPADYSKVLREITL